MSARFFPTFLLLAAACGSGSASSMLDAPYVAQEVIVVLEEEGEEDIQEVLEDLRAVHARRIGNSAFFILQAPPDVDLEEYLHDVDSHLRVASAQPNYLAESPEGGPSDAPIHGSTLFSLVPEQPSLLALGIEEAHLSATGAGVVVAVVDTGVDAAHPLLAGRVLPGGFDFVGLDEDPSDEPAGADRDGDGLLDEQYGHGTFVASIVLAVAPGASILPVRVLDAEGWGSAASVASGVLWAVDAGAHVINLSVHTDERSEVIRHALEIARERGVLVVAPAGNEGRAEVSFPAREESVIAVAAVDDAGVAAPFTNRGEEVALSAPGVSLLGAVPQTWNPAGTAWWSGTSFAAPVVSGAAALVHEREPQLGRSGVRSRLLDAAAPIDHLNPGLAGRLGRGRVDAAAAVR